MIIEIKEDNGELAFVVEKTSRGAILVKQHNDIICLLAGDIEKIYNAIKQLQDEQ